jgi:hypothetical protein
MIFATSYSQLCPHVDTQIVGLLYKKLTPAGKMISNSLRVIPNAMLATYLHRISYKNVEQEHEMLIRSQTREIWPEDPAWPDPYGNDPYDIGRQ